MRAAVAIACALLCVSFAHAADLIAVAGSATRAWPAEAESVSFPATIQPETAVDVVDLALDGTSVTAGNFSASIDPRGYLVISVGGAAPRASGTYALVVRARNGTTTQLLTLTLTRPLAELRFGSGAVRIARTVYLPGVACVRPTALTLNNVARYAALTPSQTTWTADLHGSDNMNAGFVRIETPSLMAPSTNALAAVDVVGHPPLGTATATLRIASPQLASGAVEQTVEVVSRLSLWWLFFTIVAGIVAGHFCRVVLERVRLRADALLSANAERAALQELIQKTPDAKDAEALEESLRGLENDMSDPRKDAAAIVDAVKRATDAAQVVISAANSLRTTLTEKIAQRRAMLGPAEGHVPAIRVLIAESIKELDAQQQALASGETHRVERDLREIELSVRFDEALAAWSAEVGDALGNLGAWPEVPRIAEVAGDAGEKLKNLKGDDLRARLDAARQLATVLRTDLFGQGRRAIVKAAEAKLSSLNVDGAVIDAARAAAGAVEAWDGESAGEALDDLTVKLAHLRSALDAAAKAPPQETALHGEESVPPPPLPPVPPIDFLPSAAAGEAPLVARLVVDGSATVGQPLTFRIVPATARPLPPVARVDWIANEKNISTGTILTLHYVPQEAHFLGMTARIEFADGSAATAETSLDILSPRRFVSSDDLLAARRRAEWIQTAAAGLLITLGGLLIFKNAFFGTIEDLAGALLWGFGTDIGLAKVREMSLPLLQQTVPLKKSGS
jgi:hypothetical protein